jgi:hypothetical protein
VPVEPALVPGVDLFTHGADDPLRQQRRYLRDIVDPATGPVGFELEDTYGQFNTMHLTGRGAVHTRV